MTVNHSVFLKFLKDCGEKDLGRIRNNINLEAFIMSKFSIHNKRGEKRSVENFSKKIPSIHGALLFLLYL